MQKINLVHQENLCDFSDKPLNPIIENYLIYYCYYTMTICKNNFVSFILCTLLWLMSTGKAISQSALKTNFLHDATATPTLAFEVGMGRKNTAQIYYGLNGWKTSDTKQWKHWIVRPEFRWWFCSKFNGHFLDVHAHGGQFNAANIDMLPTGVYFGGDDLRKELRTNKYEGSFAGLGIGYGYQWILSRHWNFETEIGVGYTHVWYDKYRCGECGAKISDGETNHVGMTKLGLSLVYVF